MIIALLGVTCVGKTTIGKLVADELNYEFYDLDAELKSYYNDTILNIQRDCIGDGYDEKKGVVLKDILKRCGANTVIAVSPIYYTSKYKKSFKDYIVFPIVLYDSPENIADRIVETDDFDNVIENQTRDIKADIRDIRYFISRYKKAFERVETKFNVAGKSADVASLEIIKLIINPQIKIRCG
jgi:shikimate kinase